MSIGVSILEFSKNTLSVIPQPNEELMQDCLNECYSLDSILKMLRGVCFSRLSPEEKQSVVVQIGRSGAVQETVKNNNLSGLEELLSRGVDINAYDIANEHCLDFLKSDEVFWDLWRLGARFVGAPAPNLCALRFCIDQWTRKDKPAPLYLEKYKDLFLSIIHSFPSQEYTEVVAEDILSWCLLYKEIATNIYPIQKIVVSICEIIPLHAIWVGRTLVQIHLSLKSEDTGEADVVERVINILFNEENLQHTDVYAAIFSEPILVASSLDLGKKQDILVGKKNYLLPTRNWMDKVEDRNQDALAARIGKGPVQEVTDLLCFLVSFWDRNVPSEVFQKIPCYPLASLVVGAIFEQAQSNRQKRGKITHFFSGLDNLERIAIAQHLFADPKVLAVVVNDQMRVKTLAIKCGGGMVSTYAKFICALMPQGNTSTFHFGSKIRLVAGDEKLVKKIREAFEVIMSPRPVKNLLIHGDATLELAGRTVFARGEGTSEGFKFLKKEENYNQFSREYSVTKVYKECGFIQSQLHDPQDVYLSDALPRSFEPFSDQLGSSPYYIYHYKILSEDIKTYLQNSQGDVYRQGRLRALIDSTQLIAHRVIPDTAALFHNEKQKRKYVFLIDLGSKLISQLNKTPFVSRFGAGRIDQVFEKIKFSNLRATGITDCGDASLLMEECRLGEWAADLQGLPREKDLSLDIYQIMHALSSLLLVDMLILTLKHIQDQNLDWTDEQFLEEFARELVEGYATVGSVYCGIDFSFCENFSQEMGIDWKRAAKQIAFWADISANGYPQWITKQEIPEGLYEKTAHLTVDLKLPPYTTGPSNFKEGVGFQSNGCQDFGIFNGPLALTEFEKAMHLLYFFVVKAGVAIIED